VRSRWLEKLAETLWEYLARAAIAHIATALGFVAPVIYLGLTKGVAFFTRPASVSGWLLALGTGALLSSLLWTVLTIVRQRARPHTKYAWRGLEWPLRAAFWGNYEHFRAEDMAASFLSDCLGGPFCGSCKRAVAVRLEGKGEPCPHCGARFDWRGLKVSEELKRADPTEAARRAAYVDAQGDARAHRM